MNPESNKPVNKSVKDGPVLRDHVFDGIEEFDQKLPNWWLFTFYIAIAFYVGYWVIYYSSDLLQSPAEKINAQMELINDAKKKELAAMLDELDNKVLIQWSENADIVAEGEAVFKTTCAACHGADLNGTAIGRSLMDDEWSHGGEPMDLFNLVLNGSPADAEGFNGQKMTAWGENLGPEKCAKAVAYVLSKNPPKSEE
ncbi:c-type cytochrome [Verrucomicrobiaceae bacterium N1E253]|uniref:C-type cytochrome n=1 Tax=Oceaniferula marina TaxID=2748318 RepID=A0A851GNW8_9BACT|nr:cbb3-type cytochrome c oxidase N-terminal domain-containing protein [Oceaniferula marina]NWK56727.1 c-type cytochrome [Oceaniferula marina]